MSVMVESDPEFINEWNANLLAIRLRQRGVSYPSISVVIEEVYGIRKSGCAWRQWLRERGAEAKPRGVHPRLARG